MRHAPCATTNHTARTAQALRVFYCLQLMIRLLTNGVKNQKFSSVTLRSTTENLTAALRAYNAALARAVYGATSVRAKSKSQSEKRALRLRMLAALALHIYRSQLQHRY